MLKLPRSEAGLRFRQNGPGLNATRGGPPLYGVEEK